MHLHSYLDFHLPFPGLFLRIFLSSIEAVAMIFHIYLFHLIWNLYSSPWSHSSIFFLLLWWGQYLQMIWIQLPFSIHAYLSHISDLGIVCHLYCNFSMDVLSKFHFSKLLEFFLLWNKFLIWIYVYYRILHNLLGVRIHFCKLCILLFASFYLFWELVRLSVIECFGFWAIEAFLFYKCKSFLVSFLPIVPFEIMNY